MSEGVKTLPVLVSQEAAQTEDAPATRGIWGSRAGDSEGGLESTRGFWPQPAVIARKEISVEALRASLDQICDGLQQVFQDAQKVGDFQLKEVTVQVEIGAEGGFELVGTGKVSGKGAITLKFQP